MFAKSASWWEYSGRDELSACVDSVETSSWLCVRQLKHQQRKLKIFLGLVLLALVLVRPLQNLAQLGKLSLHQALDLREKRATAWFDRVYVINTAHRTDRRAQMSELAQAADFQVQFVTAVTPNDTVAEWTRQRVVQDSINAGQRRLLRSRFDNVTKLESSLWQGEPWKKVLLENILDGNDTLRPDPNFDWSGRKWEAQTPPELACTLSHIKVWSDALRAGCRSILSLEDDVDVDFHLKSRWEEIERALPETWDAVYLGYCHTSQFHGKVMYHPNVHEARKPWCTHAIAYSNRGLRKLMRYLQATEDAWLDTIDAYLRFLIRNDEYPMEVYSVVPALVIQDTGGLANSNIDDPSRVRKYWRGLLSDSTLDRVKRNKGTFQQRTVLDLESDEAISRMSG